MAESVDPETARQAAPGVVGRLHQPRVFDTKTPVAEWEAVRKSEFPEAMEAAGDALAVLVPQLLDQLAAYGHAVDGFEDERDAFDIEATRMGERVRQSESALAEAQTSQEELATRVSELEAALKRLVMVLDFWETHIDQQHVALNQATSGDYTQATELARAALLSSSTAGAELPEPQPEETP